MRLPPERPFEVVFFDCDSTLSAIEGIDELARRAGVHDEVAAMTLRAMEGEIPLQDVYALRLGLVRPTRLAIEDLASQYLLRMVDGAPEVFGTLHGLGKKVHLVSGGIRQALLPLAARLGVAADRVHAVELRFDESGAFLDHDAGSPLGRSGGKALACASALQWTPGRSVIVGDGMTDMEARPPCDAAIGFGGVVARQPVRAAADGWVAGPSLSGVLDLILTGQERRT